MLVRLKMLPKPKKRSLRRWQWFRSLHDNCSAVVDVLQTASRELGLGLNAVRQVSNIVVSINASFFSVSLSLLAQRLMLEVDAFSFQLQACWVVSLICTDLELRSLVLVKTVPQRVEAMQLLWMQLEPVKQPRQMAVIGQWAIGLGARARPSWPASMA